MDYCFDYLRFTVRTDKNAVNPAPVDLATIQSILGFSDEVMQEFQSIFKGSMYYADSLRFEDISISIPFPETADVMGYMVTMTGNGCRLFEKLHRENALCWRSLFTRIRSAVSEGCDINICRLDIAFDDKSDVENGGLLDLNEIERCADNRDFVSLFRNTDGMKKGDNSTEYMEYTIKKRRKKGFVGRMVDFGNRRSNAYCRFYDKLTERLVVEYKGKIENAPDDFKKLKHWVRCEFELKRTVALKVVNAFLNLNDSDFSEWLGRFVNTYIRFINRDDSCVSRCSVLDWWQKFVGTVEKAKLTSGHFVKSDYVSAFKWFERSLAPTLNAMLNRVGEEQFLKLIEVYGSPERWKAKHKRISDNTAPIYDLKLSCSDIWLSNIPLEILDDDFYSSDCVGTVVDIDSDNMSIFDNSEDFDNSVNALCSITEWDEFREAMYNLGYVEVVS